MKKSTWGIIGGAVVLVLVLSYFGNQWRLREAASVTPAPLPQPTEMPTPLATQLTTPIPTGATTVTPATSPLNATYLINNQPVTLVNGTASTPAAPGSASTITTTIWGTPAQGHLNEDELVDQALILTQTTGGSGQFFYVAAAVNQNSNYVGTNAELLGDRIAMQMLLIKPDKLIEVNYAVQPEDAAMTDRASEAVSSYFTLNGLKLVPAPNPNVTGN